MKKSSIGFTLIEIMIAIAIVAILAAIAVPNYTTYITQSRRNEAQTNLLSIQAEYEQYFAQNNAYPTSNTLPGGGAIPSTTYYKYSSTTTTTTYTLTAQATGSQANDTQCATMTINNTGLESPSACWPQ